MSGDGSAVLWDKFNHPKHRILMAMQHLNLRILGLPGFISLSSFRNPLVYTFLLVEGPATIAELFL